MEHEHITIKIWRETLKLLRHIHAETGEAQVAVLHRLVSSEWQRLQQARGTEDVSLSAEEPIQR